MRRTLLIFLCASIEGVACGGGSSTPASAPAPQSDIARIHRARCGSCHLRVEPGERTRAEIEAVVPRHHKRVHLSEEQWAEMVDYLAARADAGVGVGAASLPDGGQQ